MIFWLKMQEFDKVHKTKGKAVFDDDLPAKKPAQKRNLEPMSIDELKEYIDGLKAEISRAEDEIRRKEVHKSAADSFFKK